jgi:hypothetical protein
MPERVTQYIVDGATHELRVAADRHAGDDLQVDRDAAPLCLRGVLIRQLAKERN